MTYAILPEDKAGLAGGIIIGAAGLGNAAGPLIGGVFTDVASWRWILFINVPIAAFAVAVVWSSVHLTEPEDADHSIDYQGIAAISIGLVSLLIALDQVDDWGWGDPRVIAMLVIAVVGWSAFVPIERRAGRHALIPAAIIANRDFAASCVAILCLSATFFAALLYLPQFMETQLGFSPLEAGLGMVPALATFALVSFVRRAALRAGRREAAGDVRRRLHVRRGAPLLAGRRRLGLRGAGAGDDRARHRDRQLLPDRDDRRGDLGRRIAGEPRGRDRLHVPDRRRLDRAGPDDDGLLRASTRRSSTASRRASGWTPGSPWSGS